MAADVETSSETVTQHAYYRRDQAKGVTPPELTKECSYAEHIVRARGKRSRYTSLSLDKASIVDFGPALYEAITAPIVADGHQLIPHAELISALRNESRSGEKEVRTRAVLAQRYALRRREGLVAWHLNHSRVERKDLYDWTQTRISPFFKKVA